MRSSIVLAALIAMLTLACGRGDSAPVGDVSAAPESARSAAASSSESDVVRECRALAERQAWASALEPCRSAAEELPNDLGIRHALQQAQAAAADKARGTLGWVEEEGR